MFVVTVNFKIAPEFETDFAAAMLQQAKNSIEREADCHVFDVCVASNDSASVYLYEKYTDAAAFDVHLASEHFKTFDAMVAPWLVSKTVNTWTELGVLS